MRIQLNMWAADDADVLETSVRYHRSQGVDDIVIELRDATPECAAIAALLEQEGAVRLADAGGDVPVADVVLHSAASDFWWPRVGTLRDGAARAACTGDPVRCYPFVPVRADRRGFGLASVVRMTTPELQAGVRVQRAESLELPAAPPTEQPASLQVFTFPQPGGQPLTIADGEQVAQHVMQGACIVDRRLETYLRANHVRAIIDPAALAATQPSESTDTRVAIALVAELAASPELVAAWVAQFRADDPITLTVVNRDMPAADAVDAMQRLADTYELESATSPDVLLHPEAITEHELEQLASTSDLVLTSQPMEWRGCERVLHANARTLAGAAGRLWAHPAGEQPVAEPRAAALPDPLGGELLHPPLDPARVVVSTVFESRAPYDREAVQLYRSLARCGGALAAARRIAYCMDEPSPQIAAELDGLGVEVRRVAPIDERCPHANKLHMLDPGLDADWVVMLDTDVVFAGDVAPYLVGSSVLAKPVDQDPFSWEGWEQLFRHVGLDIPRERYLTHFTMRETIPYFNSGVVMVPQRYVATLRTAWQAQLATLLDSWDQLPLVAPHRFFADQLAFALALAETGAPHRALPLECNFPTNEPVHPGHRPDEVRPLLIHHHHRVDARGAIETVPHREASVAIAMVNEALAEVEVPVREPAFAASAAGGRSPGVHFDPGFDNRDFWNDRYATNMELGSGIGSRNEIALYKRAIMQELITGDNPQTLLDVGCGDIEIVRGLTYGGSYLGIDISDVVVERNRALMPHWSFESGNFVDMARNGELASDLVVCCDVLIHQHDREEYRALVAGLVANTRRIGFITAYDGPPAPEYTSDITAYHEPVTQTLRAAGATNVSVVGSYKAMSVVVFGPRDPE